MLLNTVEHSKPDVLQSMNVWLASRTLSLSRSLNE